MIAPTPFFADRGCHIRIYEEVCGLQKLNHNVLVCTYGIGNEIDGVKTIRCYNFPWYNKLSAGPSITKILLLPVLTITVLKQIHKFKPDIIHAHLHEGACIAKVCKIFYPKTPVIFDMQGGLCEEVLQHNFFKRGSIWHKMLAKLERYIVNWQPIIVSSSHMINDISNIGGNIENCFFVKDGINTDFFSPRDINKEIANKYGIDSSQKRLIFVGLLEKYQGIDILLNAFKLVVDKYKNAKLIIMGYPNIDYYKKMCYEIGLENNVIFTGRVNYSELPDYLSLSTIAVAPKLSQTEGNIKIYDYMSMEMITVAFDNNINREILEETGIYAKNYDKKDLADAILYAFDNEKKLKKMGTDGRKLAIIKLSNLDMAKRIENIYLKYIN